jgi:hypothetical protein
MIGKGWSSAGSFLQDWWNWMTGTGKYATGQPTGTGGLPGLVGGTVSANSNNWLLFIAVALIVGLVILHLVERAI